MRSSLYLGISLMLCAVQTVYAEADWTDSPASFICRSSNEVREIKSYIFDASGGDPVSKLTCRVDYIKNGATKTVYSSHTQRAYCDGKATQLAARLARGIFTCTKLHSQPAAPAALR